MAETLTGWGVVDPEGRWLVTEPAPNRAQAEMAAAERLRSRCTGDPGCPSGKHAAFEYFRDESQGVRFGRRLRALGYRVVRVELREVPR